MLASSAVKLLILGGLANLVLSFALGWILSMQRMRGPMEPHRWLLVAHTLSLQEGVMLLALSLAATVARLPSWLAVLGAALLVAASAFQDFSGIANWLRRTDDQFAERSLGWKLASVNAVLNSAGLSIITVGAVRGLCM